jgi:hypothetical protein
VTSRARLTALLLGGSLLAGCAGAATSRTEGPHYISPAGKDSAECTREDPCRTLNAARRRATAGGEIRLLSGRYPDQDVAAAPGGGRAILVRAADGARVRVGVLTITGHGLELRGLRLAGWHAMQGAGRLTFRDVQTSWFFADSVSDLRILGGTVGPADSVDPQIRAANTKGAPVPRNILIDGVTFHDFTARKDPAVHVECLQFGAGEHVVVRRSSFLNCATHSIFVRSWGGTAKIRDFTFADNRFGLVPGGYYSLRVVKSEPGTISDIMVRDNSATTTMQVDGGIPGVSLVGNLAPRAPWQCFAGQRYRRNVWSAVRCGPTDRQVGERAVAVAARDRHRPTGARGLAARG